MKKLSELNNSENLGALIAILLLVSFILIQNNISYFYWMYLFIEVFILAFSLLIHFKYLKFWEYQQITKYGDTLTYLGGITGFLLYIQNDYYYNLFGQGVFNSFSRILADWLLRFMVIGIPLFILWLNYKSRKKWKPKRSAFQEKLALKKDRIDYLNKKLNDLNEEEKLNS